MTVSVCFAGRDGSVDQSSRDLRPQHETQQLFGNDVFKAKKHDKSLHFGVVTESR